MVGDLIVGQRRHQRAILAGACASDDEIKTHTLPHARVTSSHTVCDLSTHSRVSNGFAPRPP